MEESEFEDPAPTVTQVVEELQETAEMLMSC
jgi:hypothetical protein